MRDANKDEATLAGDSSMYHHRSSLLSEISWVYLQRKRQFARPHHGMDAEWFPIEVHESTPEFEATTMVFSSFCLNTNIMLISV